MEAWPLLMPVLLVAGLRKPRADTRKDKTGNHGSLAIFEEGTRHAKVTGKTRKVALTLDSLKLIGMHDDAVPLYSGGGSNAPFISHCIHQYLRLLYAQVREG